MADLYTVDMQGDLTVTISTQLQIFLDFPDTQSNILSYQVYC